MFLLLLSDVLFLVGGIPAGRGVEAIDMANPSATCDPIADYPEYVYSHVGGTYQGREGGRGQSASRQARARGRINRVRLELR